MLNPLKLTWNISRTCLNRGTSLFYSPSVVALQFKSYSGKNITRNKYWDRNPDGTYKEFNESITVLPKEFADQGLIYF